MMDWPSPSATIIAVARATFSVNRTDAAHRCRTEVNEALIPPGTAENATLPATAGMIETQRLAMLPYQGT